MTPDTSCKELSLLAKLGDSGSKYTEPQHCSAEVRGF